MTARCPSELALERHLLEPETSPARDHVAACARCAARLEEMRAQGEAFHRYVFPATVAAVEDAARPTFRWRAGRWALLGAALGAAAAAVLLVRLAGTPRDAPGPSTGLGISVLVEDGAGARAVRDGEAVGAAAALRFRIQAATACRLWILALDARGEFTRLYPAEGTGGAAVAGAVEIPTGMVLDGQPGPQRIYAVCTPGPSRWKALAAQLKGGAGPGEAPVRAAPNTASLPPGAQLASVLLEKRT